VDVSGNFAYVAAGAAGLQVVNVANRAAPVVVGSLDTIGNANDIRVIGNLAYIADGPGGLVIVNVAVPQAPVMVGSIDTPGDAWDVVVRDNRAYVADGAAGLRIFDVTLPASPVLLGSIDPAGIQKGVDVDPGRGLAILASGTSGLHVVDVSNPATPTLVGSLAGGDVRDVAVQGTHAYLADGSRSFTSVDIGNPATPILRNSTAQALGGLLNDVAVQGSFALGADVFFVNGVPVINIDSPANPVPRAILNFGTFRDDDGQGMAADAGYLYLAAVLGSAFTENGTNGNSRLYIGQYIAIEDLGGVAPTISITQPQAGVTAIEGSSLPVRANADDDIAVASVTYLINGAPAATVTSEPYEALLTVPPVPGPMVIGARAIDFGGNTATATTVSVAVIPDPLTTVTGRVVDKDGSPVGGATVQLLTFTTTSASNGTFTIAGVPTVQGSLFVRATAPIAGRTARGASAPTAPVPNGTTNVGDVRLRGGRILFLFADIEVTTAYNKITSIAAAAGLFTAEDVDTFSVQTATPTVAQLAEYASVIVWSDYPYFDNEALGNVLADYVDQGGGVVTATFSHYCCGYALAGRLVTGGYVGFVPGGGVGSNTLSLATSNLAHPIMQGVTSGNLTFTHTDFSGYSLTPGSTVVARDTANYPKVAIGPKPDGRVVSIAIFPGYGPYLLSNDIARLFANALDFVR
jgi:hypothetical protein